jgi:hypothetical protein
VEHLRLERHLHFISFHFMRDSSVSEQSLDSSGSVRD